MAKHKLKVSVVISWYVNELITRLHQLYPHKERSGIARIQKMRWYYEVTDIRFPKQSNHWAETEMKDTGLQDLLEDIVINNPTQLHEWKCRIHSHHNMWCFRSGTDETAKRSFNDGNQDYRRSIVTAYTDKWNVTYKCALNVFKPVNIEFDVPVVKQEFDMDSYLQKNLDDYEVYIKALDQLKAERDKALAQAQQPYQPTEHDINSLIDILNVENTDENRWICISLLEKNGKSRYDLNINIINDTFEEQAQELLSYFGFDLFSAKIKELEDNIETYSFIGWPYTKRAEKEKEVPLFSNDDMKYKNHTDKKSYKPLYPYNDYDRDF